MKSQKAKEYIINQHEKYKGCRIAMDWKLHARNAVDLSEAEMRSKFVEALKKECPHLNEENNWCYRHDTECHGGCYWVNDVLKHMD